MKKQYGVDSMPETGDNVAIDFKISREDQDAFAVRSQARAADAQANGRLGKEITAVHVAQKKGDPVVVDRDEHPRATSMEALGKLKPVNRQEGGTVTAGNASGVNDGAAALIIASEAAAKKHGLTPIARVLGGATAGVPPRIMGFGPAPASKKLLARLGLKQEQLDVIELNEAFASQGLATLRDLGIADDDPRVNINGGAIALGHPLGMSGARITGTAALELALSGGRYSLSTMCIGVGQASRWRSNGCEKQRSKTHEGMIRLRTTPSLSTSCRPTQWRRLSGKPVNRFGVRAGVFGWALGEASRLQPRWIRQPCARLRRPR